MQENVLIDLDGNPLVSDFGISHLVSLSTTLIATTGGNAKGSLRWMAIELFTDDISFSKEADVWAFGMTVYVRFCHGTFGGG